MCNIFVYKTSSLQILLETRSRCQPVRIRRIQHSCSFHLLTFVSEVCYFIAVLSPSQRADVSVHGCNSDHTTFDVMSSGQCSVIKELRSPVAACHLQQTVMSGRATDETAKQPQLVAIKPASELLGAPGKATIRQSVNAVQTSSLMHVADSASPTTFAGSSVGRISKQSNTEHSVKLNGISDADQSLATCSGVCYYRLLPTLSLGNACIVGWSVASVTL